MPINETTRKTLEQVVHEYGRYPIEAFEFVRNGLTYTVHQIHGDRPTHHAHPIRSPHDPAAEDKSFHVSGQQLSWGLRNYAIHRYGLMASAVLHHWSITRTLDFGKIVFAMVDSKLMAKTDDDDLKDFHNVFDFQSAFNPPARPQPAATAIFHL